MSLLSMVALGGLIAADGSAQSSKSERAATKDSTKPPQSVGDSVAARPPGSATTQAGPASSSAGTNANTSSPAVPSRPADPAGDNNSSGSAPIAGTTAAEGGETRPSESPTTTNTVFAGLSSQCKDPAGDPSTEGEVDVDLLGVSLQRDGRGLLVRFDLRGPVIAHPPMVEETPASNSWEVLLASGNAVLYAFSVSQFGEEWETSLVDFSSPDGDRFGPLRKPAGTTVEALIPADSLTRLPANFTWWALTSTDREIPNGISIGDDCPNGSGEVDAGLSLPPQASRATFPG